MQDESQAAAELVEITRRFAHVVANDRVSLRAPKGEVHALVGENGAGKSTLMKILGGLYQPDSGEIRIDGQPVKFRSPADAIRAGIGMVHQHFMLVPPFTVAENVMLGQEDGFTLTPKVARNKVAALASKFRMDVNPAAKVQDLGVGEQQRVEILKVLYRNARIIILDEPTAVLTPQEVDDFFVTIRELKTSGVTIVIITHKLREVMALADSLTILRGGRSIASMRTIDTTPEEIARLMVGRDVVLPVLAREMDEAVSASTLEPKPARPVASVPALIVRHIDYTPRGHGSTLRDVSFEVNAGEILGIAGVEGNGQSELLDILTGLRAGKNGSVILCGNNISHASPRARFAAGLASVPEDRHRCGLVLDFTLRENLLLGRHHNRKDGPRLFTRRGAREMLQQFDVRPPNINARASQLSGGNQQKVVVAREFTRGGRFLIAAQPTRGVDLGAIEFIHTKLLELRAAGTAILLVSAELSEILALSDRIAVMYAGRIVFCGPNRGLTEHDLGIHMCGGSSGPSGKKAGHVSA
jgi:general nucleoside transport system ATP-binding protein